MIFLVLTVISGAMGSVTDSGLDDCTPSAFSDDSGEVTNQPIPASIEEFVKTHKEAYLLSWKAGGFLPSASIAQTMVENGFNFTNPNGTSFWKAHNMGGVKTSKLSDFPITLSTYGQDAVDITGTKPGTNVGDNTGGAYTWFKSYDAGIVGKAEFMAHQTLYTGAINNTSGPDTLRAIFQGGWATDSNYLVKLLSTYETLGKKFQWLDQEAIALYGSKPFEHVANSNIDTGALTQGLSDAATDEDGCLSSSDTSGSIVTANGAPVLELPIEYRDKLPFPLPDTNTYSGNVYPFGQCTWGAYNRAAQIGKPIEWIPGELGNGGNWYIYARQKGYRVVQGQPEPGMVICYPPEISMSSYGHVANVEYVNEDGSILVSETNAVAYGTGTRSWRIERADVVAKCWFIEGRSS